MRRTCDPRRTEAFLRAQDGVLDASVWLGRDQLHACVTPVAHAVVNVSKLREACAADLGEDATPESIRVVPR